MIVYSPLMISRIYIRDSSPNRPTTPRPCRQIPFPGPVCERCPTHQGPNGAGVPPRARGPSSAGVILVSDIWFDACRHILDGSGLKKAVSIHR